MDENIRTSLMENGLVECIDLLEKENINTIDEIRRLKISAVCKILGEYELVDLFDEWRKNYKTPRVLLFFERLNFDQSMYHLSVLARVDMNEANQPVIGTVVPVLMDQLMVASKGYVPMVSLIGGTGTGKSFLTSSFMMEESDSSRWPTVADTEQTVPTTSHVCIFRGTLRSGSKRSVNLLDLEGESGATPKTLTQDLVGLAQTTAAALIGVSHFLKKSAAARGDVIKHTMPRIAYLLSDVVIFVDTIELRREELKVRITSFAEAAHKSCNSVGWRPALIIISNRWTPPNTNLGGVDQTSSYGDIVQALSPSLFSRVALMRIPSVNADHSNADFVAQCIDRFHDKVDEFVSKVQQDRERYKCLYSEKKTLFLFREVVKWVNRDPSGGSPIKSLAELYENVVHKSNVDNCLKALHMYGGQFDNSELFLHNVFNVLSWYAYLAACDKKLGLEGDTEPGEQHKAVRERCYAAEQCTATFQARDGKVYRCCQKFQGHDDYHSNPVMVRVPSQALFSRLLGATEVVRLRWPGKFQGATKPIEHSKEFFLMQVNNFAVRGGAALLAAFSDFQPDDFDWENADSDICGLCLSPHYDNLVCLSNCHHVLCEVCVVKRKQLYPIELYPPVCVCPFCRVESPCPIFQPEEFVGFRVLSLDGGGVKGLIQVKVLQKIEAFFHPLKITNLFDVIVGTSAGGIIAMALQKNISLKRIAEYLEQMAENVLDVNKFTRTYRLLNNRPVCNTKLLEDAIKDLLGEHSIFAHFRNQLQPPHIFCTAYDILTDKTVLLGCPRALNQVATPEVLEHAQVGRVFAAKLWEAARATSAAPTFFAPFGQAGSERVFVDGGIKANCPAHLAMRMAKVLQKSGPGVKGSIDMCLSLGTGANLPNLVGQPMDCFTWAGKFIELVLDSDNLWDEHAAEFGSVKDRIRINPPKLGSVDAFASASIPLIHTGMDDFFKSSDAVHQMDILYHTMYAKLWHVHPTGNPVTPNAYKFRVSLRDLRFDFDCLNSAELRDIVAMRKDVAPSADASREQLVCAARGAVAQKLVVADLAGCFGCTFNEEEYTNNTGVFVVPTAGLLPKAYPVDVFWQTEEGHRISLSGYPTFWEIK